MTTQLPTNSSNQTNGYTSGAGWEYARYTVPGWSYNMDDFVRESRSNNMAIPEV